MKCCSGKKSCGKDMACCKGEAACKQCCQGMKADNTATPAASADRSTAKMDCCCKSGNCKSDCCAKMKATAEKGGCYGGNSCSRVKKTA